MTGNGWPQVPLGEVLSRNGEIVEISPTDVYREVTVRLWGNGVVLRREATGAEIKSAKRFRVSAGQFILSRIDARHGAFGIVSDELDGAVVSNDFPSFSFKQKQIMPEFLGWLSRTRQFVDLCRSASEGTTNRVRLQEAKFLAMHISLPPLSEQRRIVAKIDRLAEKIEEAKGLRTQIAGEYGLLLKSAVSSLAFSDTEWETTVGDAAAQHAGSVRSGPFGSQLHHSEFVESGVMAIGTRDVRVNEFRPESGWFLPEGRFEEFKRYRVFPGDLLTTIVGASIGRFCVVPNDVPPAFTTKHIMAVTLKANRVDPLFASYMLNYHPRCRDSIFSQCAGSAQPSLNATKVKNTLLPMPPIDRQHLIVDFLNNLQLKLSELQRFQINAATELDALLPSILDKAFKGEL